MATSTTAPRPGPARRFTFFCAATICPRWANANVFSIVETGFGLGLNFLATWQAWREDPQRCDRLHFVSIERHPFSAEHRRFARTLGRIRDAVHELARCVARARSGMHRLHFDDGCVSLTLAFADIAVALRQLCVSADAFFLDGFSPERNPDMWSAPNMKALARMAKQGATLATWSVARPVRDALAAAGFAVDKRPGFKGKRDMLIGHFAPRWPTHSQRVAPPNHSDKRAIVVGAGLAGAAVTSRLAARGWSIDLVERAHTPAAAASGLRAGVFQPHVSRDDCLLSRLTRAGFLYAQAQWPRSLDPMAAAPWQRCGVLQLADGADNEARVCDTAALLAYPPDYAQFVTREAASALAGRAVATGGWWFPQAGWVAPGAIVVCQLAATGPRVTLHMEREITALERVGEHWRARSATDAIIAEAPVVVIANARDAPRVVDLGVDSLRSVAASRLPAGAAVCGATRDGRRMARSARHEGIAVCGAPTTRPYG
jgi:tRNA 5-methylaminomethyl-2-thiouridine biosynthesis bifunctional protein